VDTLIGVRRVKAIRLEDLQRLARSVKRLQPFVIAADWRPRPADERLAALAPPATEPPRQMSLF
jgi:predicted DNA-binding helix-hairpin-helix protein